MKSLLLLPLFFFFCIACGQDAKEVTLNFQPKEKIAYQYEMKSKRLNLKGNLDMAFTVVNKLNTMEVTIKNLNATSDDGQDLGYNEFNGTSYIRQYDNKGKSMNMNSLPKQIINTDLFVVEFPKNPIKKKVDGSLKKPQNQICFLT